MCGRYTLTMGIDRVSEEFDIHRIAPSFAKNRWTSRFNIAPTQEVPVIVAQDGGRKLQWMRWGLIPFWAKDPGIGNRLINARAETLAQKPAFKRSFSRSRCLVPADGFYEWRKDPGGKTPIWLHRPDHAIFAFAGLYDRWKNPADGKVVFSFTIITVPATLLAAKIHGRMPAIIAAENYVAWLDPRLVDVSKAERLVWAPPAGLLTGEIVSKIVNSARVDTEDCIKMVDNFR